jgi:hypothetical protein
MNIEPKLPFACGLPFEEFELLPILRHHQPAGHLEFDRCIQSGSEQRPELDSLGVERQLPLHALDILWVEPHEAALHLDMQAAGVGRRPASVACVDQDHVRALVGEEAGDAGPDDAAPDDDCSYLIGETFARHHHAAVGDGHDRPGGTRSQIAIGFSGTRGANPENSVGAPP